MILVNNKCFPSAKLLRDKLLEIRGIRIGCTKNPENLKGKTLHIRYGNSMPIPLGVKDTLYDQNYSIHRDWLGCLDKYICGLVSWVKKS